MTELAFSAPSYNLMFVIDNLLQPSMALCLDSWRYDSLSSSSSFVLMDYFLVKASRGLFKEVVIVEEEGTVKDEGSTAHCGETGFRPQLFHAAVERNFRKNSPLIEEQPPPGRNCREKSPVDGGTVPPQQIFMT